MISANETRPHLLTYITAWKDRRGSTYSLVIVNELSAAKHEAFSYPQGESVLHNLRRVGVIASNNL